MDTEIWKDIPGYEGKYQVSSFGRVRSLDRVIHYRGSWKAGGYDRLVKGKLLKPGAQKKSGHLSVVLGHGEAGRQVHELVMSTFIGPRPEGMDICHADGDPTNNRLSNLRYDTRSNNNLDVLRQGKILKKLTHKQIMSIYNAPKDRTATSLAKEYGISLTCASRIRRGEYASCHM